MISNAFCIVSHVVNLVRYEFKKDPSAENKKTAVEEIPAAVSE